MEDYKSESLLKIVYLIKDFAYLFFFTNQTKAIKVKVNEDLKSCHYLYYKQHNIAKSSGSESVNKKTLFVNNIPPYFTEQCIRNVFSCFGKIEQVCLTGKPTTAPFSQNSYLDATNELIRIYFNEEKDEDGSEFCFKIAYILFSQVESVEKAMKKPAEKERILINKNNTPKEGLICTGMKSNINLIL
jgi:RNA recognition motif-containing protein